ncbi:MAG: hypothetical protein K2H56_03395 [Malacoplasma sp.]|nr:hypothetical protein [Malacoplasma sp.]
MKKIIKIIFIPLFSFLFQSFLTSCSANEGFYFANFESYISQDLLDELESGKLIGFNGTQIDDFNYRTFTTNEDLERNFVTNYNMAVPSTYLTVKLANEGQLLPIDWKKFNLYKLDENGMRTNEKIEKASDALTLFTPQVRSILLTYSLEEAYAKDKNFNIDPCGGLLNYCVPYFLQNFGFAYKTSDGKSWDEFNSEYSWKTIVDSIKKHDNYVKKVSAVDDSRTLYSIGRLVETNDQNINPGPLQPQLSTTYETVDTEINYSKTYQNLITGMPRNKYYLNSDSNNVLNSFAALNGSEAIFSYNGDILFGIQGGDNYAYDEKDPSDFQKWIENYIDKSAISDENNQEKNQEFFIKNVSPNNSFLLLDTMVINRNRVKSEKEKNLAYSILYKIGLEGSDLSLYKDSKKTEYSDSAIFEENIDENGDKSFLYGPAQNFDYVQYTSPLLTLNAYVLNSDSNIDQYNNKDVISSYNLYNSLSSNVNRKGYFTDIYKEENIIKNNTDKGFLTETQYWNYIDTLISVYQIKNLGDESKSQDCGGIKYYISNFTPRNISDLNKSNMSWAYSDVKSNYF